MASIQIRECVDDFRSKPDWVEAVTPVTLQEVNILQFERNKHDLRYGWLKIFLP